MYKSLFPLLLVCVFVVGLYSGFGQTGENQLVDSNKPYFEEFRVVVPHQKPNNRAIYEQGPFAWNGQPRIAVVPDGRLFMVWCASIGFLRGNRLVGSFSADGGRVWSQSLELINNPDRDDDDASIIVDGSKLFVISTSLRMPDQWDKFNPFPVRFDRTWWYMTESDNGGRSWSFPISVAHPHRYAGHRSNGFFLNDRTLLLPYYEVYNSEGNETPKLENDLRSASGMARSTDDGKTWTSGQMINGCGADDCDEPAVVHLSNGEFYCLMRSRTEHLYESRSHDNGLTWDKPRASALRSGMDVPFALARLEGRGDELVALWNYPDRRWLVASYSADAGQTWTDPKVIAKPDPKAGYWADNPSICQSKTGIIIAVWQQETLPLHLGKEIHLARFNRAWLLAK